MTPAQVKLLHVAARQVGLSDDAYRMLLKNTGGVGTSLNLSNAGFEDCMAVLEDLGFRQGDARHETREGEKNGNAPPGLVSRVSPLVSATYWRDKVRKRGSAAGERMVYAIRDLARGGRYQLPALVARFSGGRTEDESQLLPREAWKLIEMLKAAKAREGGNKEGRRAGTPSATLFDKAARKEPVAGRTPAFKLCSPHLP